MKVLVLVATVSLILVAGGWWYWMSQKETVVPTTERETVEESRRMDPQEPAAGAVIGGENLVEFSCKEKKKITAVFARDIVGLTLSDGRQIELRQTPSGSGIRYRSNDGTIEFHGAGDEGFLVENGITTFAECVVQN